MPNLKLIHNLQPNTAIGDISIDMTKLNPIYTPVPYEVVRPEVDHYSDQVKAIAMIMDIQSRMAIVEAQLASILKILGERQ